MIDTASLHLGRWWSQEGEKIQCDLCPRHCQMKPGQRGFCFVRQATSSGMALTTYGRSSGFCIDPIEKKPLNHFFPGSSVLSFGTAGCNLGCKFCQNWDISKSREMDRLMDVASPEGIAETAQKHGCRSIAFTYNDPVIFAEYAIDVAQETRKRGIKNVAVTAGYITKNARAEFFEEMDAVNVDLKAFTQRFYRDLCAGEIEPVKDTLRYLVHETDIWVEITTLLIPEENDGDDEIRELAAWVREELRPTIPIHFSAYHPDYKLKRPKTPPSTLTKARAIAMEEGLQFVYTGNVHDPAGDNTHCPNCNHLLIERDWYALGQWGLSTTLKGTCSQCGAKIPGHFDANPGQWGRRRQPVRVGR
ncbi:MULTISPECIES: AmmeMemoRadiSam system radical SAM enzyme [unclassified Prochlorococcus]|uniref:AmmeMemoRadiSam system radical SAM enzyme n=2 Tax=unclassified Prochlorococcus TaxID=2627481 RepID=UPI00055A2DFF|nr:MULTISPECIES: AmmeMemoRadiSam system radical SAM enzyme [unclassified Prochlorococcus]